MESQQYGRQLELSWGLVFMHKRDQSDDSANRSPRNGLAHMHNGICQCGINSHTLSREGTASLWKVDHSAGLRLGLYSKIQQFQTSWRSGEGWGPPGYSCPRHTTRVELLWSGPMCTAPNQSEWKGAKAVSLWILQHWHNTCLLEC